MKIAGPHALKLGFSLWRELTSDGCFGVTACQIVCTLEAYVSAQLMFRARTIALFRINGVENFSRITSTKDQTIGLTRRRQIFGQAGRWCVAERIKAIADSN